MGMIAHLTPITVAQFDDLKRHPDHASDLVDDNDNALDLDKAWHGIHYLLTGTAWGGEQPLGQAVVGGEAVGPDLGYGPAMLVTPEQVAAIASALAAMSEETLAARFNPQDMDAKQIYPTIWVRDGEDGMSYLLPYFRSLKRLYADAAARGDAVLQWID